MFQGYTGAPATHMGQEQTNLARSFTRKARASIPKVDKIRKRAPQGLQETPHSRAFRTLHLGACFLEHRKPFLDGSGGRDVQVNG